MGSRDAAGGGGKQPDYRIKSATPSESSEVGLMVPLLTKRVSHPS